MKNQKLTTTLLIIITVIAIIGAISFRASQTNQISVDQAQAMTLFPQTDNQGEVVIKVAPLGLTTSKWQFEVSLDTHSVELDVDLTKSSVLIVDGREFQPVSWDGSPSGGHHREGTLTFASAKTKVSSIELVLRNIGGVPERSFTWTI